MKLIFLFLFISTSAYAENSAGVALLNAYSCQSVGAKTNEQRASMRALESVVKNIQGLDECKGLAGSLGTLPRMDSIIEQLDALNKSSAIREQEIIINQNLADLHELEAAQNRNEDLSLYPDPGILRASIVRAREQIMRLKSQNEYQKYLEEKKGYQIGLRELDEYATRIATALKDPENNCFKKVPSAYGQMTAGLAGISGFFMSQPLGLATSIAGKLIQSMLSLAESRVANKRRNEAFKDYDDLTLVTGLSCAFESLGSQKCKISKEKQLFVELLRVKRNEGHTSITGNGCLDSALRLPDVINGDLARIIGWVGESNSLGIGIANAQQYKTQAALNEFDSFLSQRISSLSSIDAEEVGGRADPNMKAKRRRETIYTHLARIEEVLQDSPIIQQQFSEEELSQMFIALIVPSTDRNQVPALMSELGTAFRKYQADVSGSTREGNPNTSMQKLPNASEMWSELSKTDPLPPIIEKINSIINNKDSTRTIAVNIKSLGDGLKANLSAEVPEERLQDLMMSFYGNSFDGNSPIVKIQNIEKYLNTVAQLPLSPATKGLLNINKLSTRFKAINQKANELQENLREGRQVSKEEWASLIGDMNSLVGSNNNLSLSISSINQAVQSYIGEQLSRNGATIDPTVYNQILFKMNQGLLESTIALSENPTNQMIDYTTAEKMSEAHIKGLASFVEPQIKQALGLETLEPSLKSKLCISLLSMPEISREVKTKCKGVTLVGATGQTSMSFDQLAERSLNERACAYDNFLSKEKFLQNSRSFAR